MNKSNWIFVRGLSRGSVHWGDFVEIFKKMNPDARAEFLEIPGNGYLSKEVSPTSPYDLINVLLQKSEIIKSNEPYNLCGISLGGMIVLKWAELFPKNIQRVIVINSSLAQFSNFKQRLLPQNYLKMINGLMKRDVFEREKTILDITSNYQANIDKYLLRFSEFAKENRVRNSNFFRQLFLAKNIFIKNKIDAKIYFIGSAQDKLVDIQCSKNLAAFFKAKLIIHPTAGHDLPLDEPLWLAEQITMINLN